MAIAIRRFRSSTYGYSQFIPTGWVRKKRFRENAGLSITGETPVLLSLGNLCDALLQGLGPQGVACGIEMKEVGHDFFSEGAIGLEEGGCHVEKVYVFVIDERLAEAIDFIVEAAHFIVFARCTREDVVEDDFGLRGTRANEFDDGRNALCRFDWILFHVSGVVGANEQTNHFGLKTIPFAVVETP